MSGSKVIVVGVGADSTNVKPIPNLKEGGPYHYIPIPETWLTSNQYTFGDLEVAGGDSIDAANANSTIYAADEVDEIRPFGKDGEWIVDKEIIENHPVHYDPNFEDLTYGDKRGRGGRGANLADLKPGDGLAFYTGIEDGSGKQRYIWGYFQVAEVADLRSYGTKEYRNRLREFPQNAHAKRLLGAGKAKHEGGSDPSLVIVDGTTPAKFLEEPVKISTSLDSHKQNAYWLTESFIDEFKYNLNRHSLHAESGLAGVDIKHALYLELDMSEFERKIDEWQSRQY